MIAYVLPKNQEKVQFLRAEYNKYLDIKFACWEKLNEGTNATYTRMIKNAAASAHDRMMECEEKIHALTEYLESI